MLVYVLFPILIQGDNKMAKIITIANQKGGVGKSTTVLSIADSLSRCEYRVLVVDTDPQCNSN